MTRVDGDTQPEQLLAAASNVPASVLFNVNHCVRVRLKPSGRVILEHCLDDINAFVVERGCAPIPPRTIDEDAEGWSEWQLWDLMHVFGPHMQMGAEVPFETEIEIPLSDPAVVATVDSRPQADHARENALRQRLDLLTQAVQQVCAHLAQVVVNIEKHQDVEPEAIVWIMEEVVDTLTQATQDDTSTP